LAPGIYSEHDSYSHFTVIQKHKQGNKNIHQKDTYWAQLHNVLAYKYIQGVPKNDPTCFCQNFVKSTPNLIIFGTPGR